MNCLLGARTATAKNMPVRWKATQRLEAGGLTLALTAPLVAAASTATPPTTTASWAKPRRTCFVSENCKAPLHDHVELTPGGHRKHSLQRTSPGGTTRKAHYISPLKGDACKDDDVGRTESGILENDRDVELEQYFRRCDALHEVPGSQSDAQRSAVARAKRKAGVPAAPQAKRSDRKPWGAVQRERHESLAALGVVCPCGACRVCRFGKSY